MGYWVQCIISVLIKALAEAIAASLKLIEPFQRMACDSAVAAGFTLSAQYLSSSISFDSAKSLADGRLLTFWSTFMHVLLSVATPLASASMSIRARSRCIADGNWVKCDPAWIVNVPIMRSVEATLIVCFALGVLLVLLTWKRGVRLSAKPSCIATVATLLNHKVLMKDLQKIDPEADGEAFNAAIASHRFRLDQHEETVTGLQHYGIITSRPSHCQKTPMRRSWLGRLPTKKLSVQYAAVAADSNDLALIAQTSQTPAAPVPRSSRKRRLISQSTDGFHLLTSLTLFSLLMAHYFNHRSDSFNDFFNSEGPLPRLLLVGLAVLVDAQMKNLERIVRITEPYRRLSLQDSRAETTILMPLNGTCWSNLPRCIYCLLRYRDSHLIWQTTVGVVAALSDLNIIAVAGVPYSEQTTWTQYLVCTYSVMSITGCIIAVVLATMIWWKSTKVVRNMPRRPETIGTVLSYLCASDMVQWITDVNMEELSDSQRRWLVTRSGKKYCFDRTNGTDGKVRWSVDFRKG